MEIDRLAMREQPVLAMLPKKADFVGDALVIPVNYGYNQGRSATVTSADANGTESKSVKFVITRRAKEYMKIAIDNETIQASASNLGAFVAARKFEIDGAIESVGRALGKWVTGDGSASLGRISSGQTTNTWVLTNAADAANFEVGMSLVTHDQLYVSSASNALVVSAVDEDAGTITVTGTDNASASDYIVQAGDAPATALSTANMLVGAGLGAWIPSSVTATSFWGVDRTVHSTRLGGHRYTGTGLPKAEALIRAAHKVKKAGGNPDVAFVDYATYTELELELGARVQYVNVMGQGVNVGFTGVSITFPGGKFTVLPDTNMPVNTGFILTSNTWCIHHLNALPHLVTDDGLSALRTSWATADTIEIKVRAWYQLACTAPGRNIRVAF
jgi:hypothetical protein